MVDVLEKPVVGMCEPIEPGRAKGSHHVAEYNAILHPFI